MATMKLQIFVDKKKNRVLFAEVKKDFVDFIIHILSLPLGAVHRILAKNTSTSILGSLGTLQDGLNNLDAKYMEDPAKDYILNLKAPYWGRNTTLLLPEASCSYLRQFYQCSKDQGVSVEARCVHRKYFCSREINLRGTELVLATVQGNGKGYVKEMAMFMVMDNLLVRPAEPTSVFSLMKELSIKDVGDIEKREVTFCEAKAIQLLKASMSSKTVLTDVFLGGAVKAEN